MVASLGPGVIERWSRKRGQPPNKGQNEIVLSSEVLRQVIDNFATIKLSVTVIVLLQLFAIYMLAVVNCYRILLTSDFQVEENCLAHDFSDGGGSCAAIHPTIINIGCLYGEGHGHANSGGRGAVRREIGIQQLMHVQYSSSEGLDPSLW